jgi:hypothetical protein
LVTQIFTGGTQLILALYIFKLKPDFKYIFLILLFVGVVAVLGSLSKQIPNWGYGYLSMIAASVVIAFLLRLINLRDIYKIIFYQ